MPTLARTQQMMKEQLGQADDKVRPTHNMITVKCCSNWKSHQTKLPDDYLELEKRVDALKLVHQKLLQVTYVAIKHLKPRWIYIDKSQVHSTVTRHTTTRPISGSLSTILVEPCPKRSIFFPQQAAQLKLLLP
jgi:hypothetical protein